MIYKNKLLLAGVIALSGAPLAASGADNTVTAPSDSGPQLEEIVITAQKRSERLSDTPVAASVVSASELASMNAGDIVDLDKLVPSVDLVGSFNGRVPYGIRGISSNANEATVGLASGVGIMIDGIPIPPMPTWRTRWRTSRASRSSKARKQRWAAARPLPDSSTWYRAVRPMNSRPTSARR